MALFAGRYYLISISSQGKTEIGLRWRQSRNIQNKVEKKENGAGWGWVLLAGFHSARREGFHGHKTVGERWGPRLTGQRRTDPFVFRVYIFRPTSFLTATTGLGRSMAKTLVFRLALRQIMVGIWCFGHNMVGVKGKNLVLVGVSVGAEYDGYLVFRANLDGLSWNGGKLQRWVAAWGKWVTGLDGSHCHLPVTTWLMMVSPEFSPLNFP